MKRSIFLILIVSVIICSINICADNTIQKAYYLEFKNGDIHVLWTDIVDSMKVSKIDVDSIVHDKFVTQEIWMNDTIYRYSLDSISHISFQTPPPEYKPGVIKFEDGLEKYITACDSLTIYISKDTPIELLP